MSLVLEPGGLEAAIRAVGHERYHDKHPFHKLLYGGKLSKPQVRAWALNRYCYQAAVPRKDAALVSRTEDRALRREWARRIQDHDGRRHPVDDQGELIDALWRHHSHPSRGWFRFGTQHLPARTEGPGAYLSDIRSRPARRPGTEASTAPGGTRASGTDPGVGRSRLRRAGRAFVGRPVLLR